MEVKVSCLSVQVFAQLIKTRLEIETEMEEI